MAEKKDNTKLIMMLLKGRTLIVLALLVVFFSLATPNFLSANTMLLLAKHVALYGILAIGMTYVIITGGIDLSVGAVVGLAGIIAGGMIQNGVTLQSMGVTLYFSVPLVVLITIICGAAVGLINGAIITKFGVAPFIATLGTMYIARGFAMLHSSGATYSYIFRRTYRGHTGRRDYSCRHCNYRGNFAQADGFWLAHLCYRRQRESGETLRRQNRQR